MNKLIKEFFGRDKFRITAEDEDNLLRLAENDSMRTLVKIMVKFLEIEQSKIINFDLNKGSFANLAIVKARAEGCEDLIKKLLGEISRVVASNTNGEKR